MKRKSQNTARVVVSLMASILSIPTVFAAITITPGGANSGIGAFQNGNIIAGITGSGQSGANLRPAGTASTPDSAFQSAWFFRGAGDTREFNFGNGTSGGLTVSGTEVGTNDGTLDTGGYNFTVGNTSGYSFTSQQRWQISNPSNTANTNVSVMATNTVTNTGASAATISLFFFQDFDINGSASGDSATLLSTNLMQITDSVANFVQWNGIGADGYRAGAFATARLGLNDAVVDDFADTGLPFGPGDFTGAFQWDVTLAPNESVVLSSAFILNGAAIPEPTTLCLVGFAFVGLLGRRNRLG